MLEKMLDKDGFPRTSSYTKTVGFGERMEKEKENEVRISLINPILRHLTILLSVSYFFNNRIIEFPLKSLQLTSKS